MKKRARDKNLVFFSGILPVICSDFRYSLHEQEGFVVKIAWNTAHPGQALVITTLEDLKKDQPDLLARTTLLQVGEPVRWCKVMVDQGELSGTFVIPNKTHPINDQITFSFIVSGESLYFIGDAAMKKLIDGFMSQSDMTLQSPVQFVLRFLNYVIQEDVYFLEDYNEKMQQIEEDLFEGHSAKMERFIMMARKDMNILANYYLQLSAVGQSLQQMVIPQNNGDESAMISVFLSRTSQLLALVNEIKDYTSQIWNLRQTQLSDKQNKISTLLTIISTIFLPLTFLTGWYGMNFPDMPMLPFLSSYAPPL